MDFENNVRVVESPNEFLAVLRDLQQQPLICVDTETVGLEGLGAFKQARQVRATLATVEGLLERYEGVYRLYKGKRYLGLPKHKVQWRDNGGLSKEVRHHVNRIANRLKRGTLLALALEKYAQSHPGGLHHYENMLGCVQLGVEVVPNEVYDSYLIRPSAIQTEVLGAFLNDREHIILQFCQFDWKQFAQHLKIHLHCKNLFDTQIAEYVLTAGTGLKTSLKETAKRRLGVEIDKNQRVRVSDWSGAWDDDQVKYGALDVVWPILVAHKQGLELLASPQGLQDTFHKECSIVPYTAQMEMEGLCIDRAATSDLLNETVAKRLEAALECALDLQLPYDEPESIMNVLNSPTQLKGVFGGLGIEVPSTDEKVLKLIKGKYPVINTVLEYRKYEKLVSTYLQPFLNRTKATNGVLYGSFNQCRVATGRYSSEDPNLQNFPATRRFRSLIIPKEGSIFIQGDLSSIEPRILAEITQDPVLLSAFRQGLDPYKMTASLLYGIPYAEVTKQHRKYIKAVMLGLMYGKTEFGLSKDLGISVPDAVRLIKKFFSIHLPVKRWIDKVHSDALRDGYVTTLGGRRRTIPNLKSPDPREVAKALREAVNTIIQGTAGDLMKQSIYLLGEELQKPAFELIKLVSTIHDELLMSVPNTKLGHLLGKELMSYGLLRGTESLIHTVPIKIGSETLPEWQDVDCPLGCCHNKPFEPLLVTCWGDSKDE